MWTALYVKELKEHRSCRLIASPTVPTVLRASQHDPLERRLAGLPRCAVLLSTTVRKKLDVASITLARN